MATTAPDMEAATPRNRDPDRDLVDAREAARIVGLSPKRVLTLAAAGIIPRVVWGPHRIRFLPEDLYAYRNARIGDGTLSTREVADRLDMTPDAVLRLVRSGELPAGRSGRFYRYRPEDVAKAIQAHRREARRE